MAEIKIEETHLKRLIDIKRRRFNELPITRAMWLHLNDPSEITQP